MTDWPSTLPRSFLRQGFSYKPPNNVLRSSVDVGPDKLRRRSGAAVGKLGGTMHVTTAQALTLDDFYTNILQETGEFVFQHPFGGAALNVRFTDSPSYAPFGNDSWTATLTFEVLP